MKILKHIWFTGYNTANKCIGVIASVAPHDSNIWKAYIGIGDGEDEWADIEHIVKFGHKLPRRIAIAYFPDLKSMEYSE